jgi:hypothetical protein
VLSGDRTRIQPLLTFDNLRHSPPYVLDLEKAPKHAPITSPHPLT